MNDMDPLLDESTLRRALRLESDERPPHLDAAALVLGATAMPSRAVLALTALVGTALLVAAVAVGVTVGQALWTFVAEGTVQRTILDLGISFAVLLAVPAWDAASALAGPATSVALIGVLALAFFAGTQRRELSGADAS
jgi:hypothetical protein